MDVEDDGGAEAKLIGSVAEASMFLSSIVIALAHVF